MVLTGRLSLGAQPWLADHAVGGVVVFPGAGFVELVIRAGDEVGAGVVEELVLVAPLVIAAGVGVGVQVVVGAVGESGRRAVWVYSRGGESDSGWVLHAEGMLGVAAVGPLADLSVWPPVGAVAVDISDGYERLAARGYEYGPAFRGLSAVWRRGQEVFAEVAAPAEAGVQVGGFGLHPAVLDAVLHAAALAGDTGQMVLPFAWRGVSLHAGGAARVRARISAADGEGAVSVEVADAAGLPVLSVGSVAIRADQCRAVALRRRVRLLVGRSGGCWRWCGRQSPCPTALVRLAAAGGGVLGRVSALAMASDATVLVLAGCGDAVVLEVLAPRAGVLVAVPMWSIRCMAPLMLLGGVAVVVSGGSGGLLVMVTRGAVGLAGQDVTDLGGAAVWGLVRSAQSEHPGRIVLVDTELRAGTPMLGWMWSGWSLPGSRSWWCVPVGCMAPGWWRLRRCWGCRRGSRGGCWLLVGVGRWRIWWCGLGRRLGAAGCGAGAGGGGCGGGEFPGCVGGVGDVSRSGRGVGWRGCGGGGRGRSGCGWCGRG